MQLLLIEDHKDIAANIAEYFGARGDAVAHATDGVTGLELALHEQYDAIVLDLMLPGMDGITLCRNLRQAGHTRVPILMLTAKDLLEDKVEGFEAGADDYLIKPFSVVDLDARLKVLVRRESTYDAQRVHNASATNVVLKTYEPGR